MNIPKRVAAALLGLSLVFTLAACGGSAASSSTPPAPSEASAPSTPASQPASTSPAGAGADDTDEAYQYFVENFEAIRADVPAHYDDYNAFYGLLLEMQGRGDIPFEDKLVAEGEVTDPFSLLINGQPFTNTEAEALTVYTAAFHLFTKVEGHDAVFVGYRFTDICALLEIELGETIQLVADDGFTQQYDTKNIDANTLVAITRDVSAADGPYFAPCTLLVNANYTKYLTEINP